MWNANTSKLLTLSCVILPLPLFHSVTHTAAFHLWCKILIFTAPAPLFLPHVSKPSLNTIGKKHNMHANAMPPSIINADFWTLPLPINLCSDHLPGYECMLQTWGIQRTSAIVYSRYSIPKALFPCYTLECTTAAAAAARMQDRCKVFFQ